MTEEVEPTKAREELKHKITVGEYKSVVDVILDATGRILQRITRRDSPPAFWYSAITITLFFMLIGFLVSLLTGERYSIMFASITGTITLFIIALEKKVVENTFSILRDEILDAMTTRLDLTRIRTWVAAVSDVRSHLIFSLIYAGSLYLYGWITGKALIFGIYFYVMSVAMTLLAGFLIYDILLFINLPLRLSRSQFRIHTEDPLNSEVVTQIAGMLNYAAYGYALLIAIITLIASLTGRLEITDALMVVVIGWLPLVALFTLNQYALTRIVTQAKRKTLREIQVRMAQLKAGQDIADEDTMAAVIRLWDYHDRIKRTRNNPLNIDGVFNLIRLLLLPLLGPIIVDLLRRLLGL